ncbi:GDYXXLXY domain-containing protein [Flammeovirgaceae bacterium SG7u.111]|nr:GDYXXLXY domain-containing protein [Flammeovirgaceae bacterium SG7u.132]WPO35843.1 GDYXXLXY domain-containing protein [Flammeovirgaceae bacterium SG7u.111]
MKTRTMFLLVNLLIVFGVFFYEVIKKEKILDKGELVLFELAPVDPRSLLQGDYMQLRYAITSEMYPSDIPARGFLALKLREENIADTVLRSVESLSELQEGEFPIKYFYNERFVSIGAESYFFQEGNAGLFEEARYGGLRVSSSGEGVLVGLYDENRQLIKTEIHPSSALSGKSD